MIKILSSSESSSNLLTFIKKVKKSDKKLFTAQLAGKAHQLGCPKIVLDHMRVYLYICVRFGFPHYWLYTMLLITHLPRGLRGLRTSNASWQTTVN